jgi:Holliday junction resolvase
MSAMTPEGKVKTKLVAMLKELGAWYFFPANNGFGKSGIPDVIICWHGKFIGVEVKSSRGKATALQMRCGEQIQEAGGMWRIVRSADDIAALCMFLKFLRGV